jgi:DNA-binding transcriptional LysR family regulator
MVTAARELLPEAEVVLHMNGTEEEMLELLATGRLEFGLGVDYPGYELTLPPDLTEAVLAVQPVFVAPSRDHPLADRPGVPLEALADERWLPGGGKDVRMRAVPGGVPARRLHAAAGQPDAQRRQLPADRSRPWHLAGPPAGR